MREFFMRFDLMIGGTDKGYLQAFVGFLSDSNKHQFNITLLETLEETRACLTMGRFDLCLVEEAYFTELQGHIPDKVKGAVLVLTETYTDIDTQVIRPILKYQRADQIEEILVSHFLQHTQKEMVSETGGKGKIVGFYSPCGGAGTTTAAQIFSIQKALKGHKVLFVSLEDFQSHDQVFSSLNTRNLSDCLVHMMTHTNWLLALNEMVSKDVDTGVYFLKAPKNGQDMTEVPEDLWVKWLAYIMDMGDYSYIVVDIASRLFAGGLQVLTYCNYRVFMTRMDPAADHKWSAFKVQMHQLTPMNLREHSTLLCTKWTDYGNHPKDADAVLEYDKTLLNQDRDGSYRYNRSSQVYRRVEECLSHV